MPAQGTQWKWHGKQSDPATNQLPVQSHSPVHTQVRNHFHPQEITEQYLVTDRSHDLSSSCQRRCEIDVFRLRSGWPCGTRGDRLQGLSTMSGTIDSRTSAMPTSLPRVRVGSAIRPAQTFQLLPLRYSVHVCSENARDSIDDSGSD